MSTENPAGNGPKPPAAEYAPPDIVWQEPLEDAGVYTGCSKDPFGELGPGCLSNPSAASS